MSEIVMTSSGVSAYSALLKKHSWIWVALVALCVILAWGAAMYCMSKGGNLVWAMKVSPATWKVACNLR